MNPIYQLFVLSPRGDTIINKKYRSESDKAGGSSSSTTDAFFRKVKFWENGDPPPCFNIDGLNYIHVKKKGLLFGATSPHNVSPAFVIELLNRLVKVFKDYCGVLSEEAIRKNFILIYELLDEMMDYGYPQGTSTENLKSYMYNEAAAVADPQAAAMQRVGQGLKPAAKAKPASSTQKPIMAGNTSRSNQKNEIFVDILERLNVLFSADGQVLNSSIDGCIQMKSYLTGNPELKLALNENLVIGKPTGSSYGALVMDDCNFHECARLEDFDNLRQISFFPPDGEFVLLNYRITSEFRPPFRVYPTIVSLDADPYRIEMEVMVRADFPAKVVAAQVHIKIPLPAAASNVSLEVHWPLPVDGPSSPIAEYSSAEKAVTWYMTKVPGGSEHVVRIKIGLSEPCTSATKRAIGPVSMQFDITLFNLSQLNVRSLKILAAGKAYKPHRWVRYVTQSSSYVARLT
ncbi:unnamed protein product [Chrysoparadoxa australica]